MSRCDCPDYSSSTSAHLDWKFANNGTWMDAVRFGAPAGYEWNFEGQTFEMDVQLNRYDLVPLLQMSTANGRIVIDDVYQRVIHFNVAPDDIQANLKPGTYVYDMVMVDGSNPAMRVPLLHGVLEVKQGVTYPAGLPPLVAAPVIFGVGPGNTGTPDNLGQCPLPSGIQVGDLLLSVVEVVGGIPAQNFTCTNVWTIGEQRSSGSGQSNSAWAWKIATGNDNITWVWQDVANWNIQTWVVRNASAVTPIGANTFNIGVGTGLSVPQIPTTSDQSMVFGIFATAEANGIPLPNLYTDVWSVNNVGGSMRLCYEIVPTIGVSSPMTAIVPVSGSWQGYKFEIKAS
jgi:hypothetical protein